MPPRPTNAPSHSDQLAAVTLDARQQLTAIQGYTEMLGEALEARPDIIADLQRITEATHRLVDLVASLEAEVASARNLASVDPLTGIANRRAFFELAERSFDDGAPMCLLLLDVDKFKDINDAYGHLVGDEVLKAVVERFQRAVRDGDTLARLAGDEFVLLLPDATYDVAMAVAARLRQKVSRQPVHTSAGLVPVTVSMGVAERRGHLSLKALVESADEAMYLAKRAGRDRVA